MGVVVDGHGREPLRHLEDLASCHLLDPEAAEHLLRDHEGPIEVEVERPAACRYRGRQVDSPESVVDLNRELAGRAAHARELQAFARGMEHRDRRALTDLRAQAARPEHVSFQVQPEIVERVGRVVRVVNVRSRADRPARRIEVGQDLVVDLLLPVARAGRARAGAHLVRRRPGERAEDGRVGAGLGHPEPFRLLWGSHARREERSHDE